MNMLKYKSYSAKVDYSQADELLVGEVCDIDALILFSAASVPELKVEFERAVDQYLAECAARNVEADKPYSGTFNVRVGGDLHRKAATIARTWGVSLNQVMCSAIEQIVDRHCHQPVVTQTRQIEQTVGFAGYDERMLLSTASRPVYDIN
jgi:predicted HicB family RNase H-like nuclease